LAAIRISQTAAAPAATWSHITAHRISAPSPIDSDVRCQRSYSVATWSARARARSEGATAASADIAEREWAG
jgi:hypothetical protein